MRLSEQVGAKQTTLLRETTNNRNMDLLFVDADRSRLDAFGWAQEEMQGISKAYIQPRTTILKRPASQMWGCPKLVI